MKTILPLLVWVFLHTGIAAGENVDVTYLGNEGFLIRAGDTGILIDALFGDGLQGYPVVPLNVRKAAEKAEGDFANVRLILASHHHPDHFDAEAVAGHLARNNEARFFGTNQAVAKLQATSLWKDIESRVTSGYPKKGESVSFEHAGIKFVAYNLHHGKDIPRPAENIGWMIEIAGKTFLHTGDTEITAPELLPLKLKQREIDVGFLPFWFFVYEDWKNSIAAIGAKQHVVMHVPDANAPADYFGKAGGFQELQNILKQSAGKDAWIAVKPGDSREYDQ